jgi:hypothetical protein
VSKHVASGRDWFMLFLDGKGKIGIVSLGDGKKYVV